MLTKKFVQDWIAHYMRDQNTEQAVSSSDYIIMNTASEVTGVHFLTSVYVDRRLPGEIAVPIHAVDGAFACDDQNLESAVNLPRHVTDECSIRSNPLTSLVGGPLRVAHMDCSGSAITSCVGAPQCTVLDMSQTQITDFVGVHAGTEEIIAWQCSRLHSPKGVPAGLRDLDVTYNAHMPLLQCLTAQRVHFRIEDGSVLEQPLTDILNKYAGRGQAGIIHAARDLIQKEYTENARW